MIGLDVHRIGNVRDLGDGHFLLDVLPAYLEGLDGLTTGVRAQVLYWMHELMRADRRPLRVQRMAQPAGTIWEPGRRLRRNRLFEAELDQHRDEKEQPTELSAELTGRGTPLLLTHKS